MTTRVVIAGGGVAALEALLALHTDARDLVDVTLVADTDTFAYRSLQVGEAFGLGHPRRYSLASLAENGGARFVHASVASVRAGARELVLGKGERMPYDALLLALGASSVPAFDHGETFAPGAFEEILDDLRSDFAGDIAIVVPRGVSWSLAAYELALMTATVGDDVSVRVVTHEAGPLDVFGPQASSAVADVLRRAGVEVIAAVNPDVPADGLVRAGDRWLTASRVVSLPVPVGPRLHGVPSTADGYLDCDQHGRLALDARHLGGRRWHARSRSSRVGSPPSRPTPRRPTSPASQAPPRARGRSARSFGACFGRPTARCTYGGRSMPTMTV